VPRGRVDAGDDLLTGSVGGTPRGTKRGPRVSKGTQPDGPMMNGPGMPPQMSGRYLSSSTSPTWAERTTRRCFASSKTGNAGSV
jgi:hypothetical protein